MTRYVALLRGINVGGRTQLAMDDLRETLRSLGHDEVETYLRSGNALFTSRHEDPSAVAREIEKALESRLGLELKVLVRTPADLERIVAANPLRQEAADEPSRVHVAFLSVEPHPDRLAGLDRAQFEPDELHPHGREIYLWYPDGAGRSKLTNDLLERRLGVTATARNWNTVTKILERTTGSGGD